MSQRKLSGSEWVQVGVSLRSLLVATISLLALAVA